MRRTLIFLIVLIFCSTNVGKVFSQDEYTNHRTYHSEIDSLENLLNNESLDKDELLNIYYGLSFAYSEGNQDKFAHYSILGMNLAKEIKDYVVESTMLRNYIAYLSFNGINDSVASYHERALEVLKEIEKTDNEKLIDRELSLLAGTMGNHYNISGKSLKAIEEYQKALRIFEKYDQKESLVILYSNVAQLYLSIENDSQAEVNMLKALEVTKQMNDSLMMMYVNHDLCDLEIYRRNYNKAKEYATFCCNYMRTHDEEGLEYAEILCIMSRIYRMGDNNYDKAETTALESLDVAERYCCSCGDGLKRKTVSQDKRKISNLSKLV